MRLPTVSVALCTYNGARYLDAQLRSLAGQTFLPFELVVSDDGSTDDTAAIVAEFGRTAPFPVRFHQQPTNLGVARNFAAALSLCQGELIALCDQDDVWLPDKLSLCAGFLQAHSRCLAVFTEATVVDENLSPHTTPSLWKQVGLTHDIRLRLQAAATSLTTLMDAFYVTGATLVIRRELLRHALPIPEKLPAGMIHDGWLTVVAAALGQLDSLAQATILYRQHPRQQVGLTRAAARRQSLRALYQHFDLLATNGEKLYSALAARLADHAAPGALEALQHRAAHFRRRTSLPDSFLQRIRSVVHEWKLGGYKRFCRHPLFAALRDVAALFAPSS